MSAKRTHRFASTAGRIAVITGASSGIGRAVALALGRAGFRLCIIGRNRDRLAKVIAAAQRFTAAKAFQLDLRSEEHLRPLVEFLSKEAGRVDILFHGAGVIHENLFDHAHVEHLDEQFAVNVRAPYLLTQQLLHLLVKARGHIVFVNSSAGIAVNRPEVAQYAATKHALKAIADGLRAEVNSKGVRVLSIYLGRTATAMQETLFRQEGKPYHGESLLQPADVATMVLAALSLPPTAEVTDIAIRPMHKG